jgi:hypothetical protein
MIGNYRMKRIVLCVLSLIGAAALASPAIGPPHGHSRSNERSCYKTSCQGITTGVPCTKCTYTCSVCGAVFQGRR